MANVPNGVETLRKISIAWVGRTNVTDRQADGRRHIANVNVRQKNDLINDDWSEYDVCVTRVVMDQWPLRSTS